MIIMITIIMVRVMIIRIRRMRSEALQTWRTLHAAQQRKLRVRMRNWIYRTKM